MTSQPMDYRDYLNRQQQQAWQRSQIDKLFPKSDEDHAADQAELVSQQRTTPPRHALSAPRRSRRR
jgi:hypothetical protein